MYYVNTFISKLYQGVQTIIIKFPHINIIGTIIACVRY